MAASLPDEIWVDILDHLDSADVVSAQRVSSRLLKLGRDNTLWRYKCFEKAPSAAAVNSDRPEALAALTGALGGLSISGSTRSQDPTSSSQTASKSEQGPRISKRAKAVAAWDHTAVGERVDWYSEYVARHAPISTDWLEDKTPSPQEIRGVATHQGSSKAVGCLEDGTVCIWDIRERIQGRRRIEEIGRSAPGLLFANHSNTGEASSKAKDPAFTGIVECVNVDSQRQKAYIGVEQVLNEVDLETLEVISQNRYAWPITALSQQGKTDAPLSVGTSWSLHLYDPRVPLRDRSRSPEDLLRTNPADPEDSIAFLPNYMKGHDARMKTKLTRPLPTSPAPTIAQIANPQFPSFRPSRRLQAHLSDYAHMEPGPVSILHHGHDEILIAGRFPSILSYDRRYFPRLQYVMHSGARLSAITTISHPPKPTRASSGFEATLVACGEYGGRGSLELYSLPHTRGERRRSSQDFGLGTSPPELGAADREHALAQSNLEQENPYSYKNRQEASSSKLLSVATQGTRIVFSDAEGGLKWVERDGRGLARRWNINSWQVNEAGGSLSGEQVVRKIVPLESVDSERGSRGDDDLLIWTGEKIGIVTTKPQWTDHDELVKAFEQKMDLGEQEEQEKAEEYSRTMRKALERQADERRWMSQFRLKRPLH